MKKVYLETPEAVIKALKEGKTIKTDHWYAYELKDNFIIQKILGKIRSINTAIFFDEDYYIEESEPLKIEVGKWYETRDHRKARCYNFDNNSYFFTIDNCTVFMTDTKGSSRRKQVSDLDIIGPWDK